MTVGHQVFEWSQNPLEEHIDITEIPTEDLKAFQRSELILPTIIKSLFTLHIIYI